jgi:hypothetical protein
MRDVDRRAVERVLEPEGVDDEERVVSVEIGNGREILGHVVTFICDVHNVSEGDKQLLPPRTVRIRHVLVPGLDLTLKRAKHDHVVDVQL